MKHVCRKTANGFQPTDGKGRAAWSKLKAGDLFMLETKRQRSLQHHRKFWSLCSFLAEHSSIENAEQVCGLLKLRTGHCDVVETARGTERIPRSISFGSMDQNQFEAFYEGCIGIVITDILPGVQRDDLRRELEEYLR